ncbi:alpha-1,4-N-acetylglucosaminyltransferase-like [Pyxicephalus adspersus]|uniref:alpha-1,4-N-acetylglucosaminyltransferase-like n=1 Tax=Pyxicephalus adspersus TaxID=30357 RepID=UPI003B590A02
MIQNLKITVLMLFMTAAGFLYRSMLKGNNVSYLSYIFIERRNDTADTIVPKKVTAEDILSGGNSIIFVETGERIRFPSLVLCAIESAARVYPNRSVVFLIKNLNHTYSEEQEKRFIDHYPTISSLNNVYIFPLVMEDVFSKTPLSNWYQKIDIALQSYWIHVSSDGCRLALIWKYGGIYMDTDIISMRPIPNLNFLAAQSSQYSSNGVFGFSPQHHFTWTGMENFVQNYNSKIWGNQGPTLITRVLKTICNLPNFNNMEDIICGNISFLNPQRFYPIPYPAWERYYEVWTKLPTFNESYALHLWNYMNNKQKTMEPGSNTLVEHLYQQYCPSTYAAVQGNKSINI